VIALDRTGYCRCHLDSAGTLLVSGSGACVLDEALTFGAGVLANSWGGQCVWIRHKFM